MSRYVYYQAAQTLNRTLPLKARLWLAERFGELQWRCARRDRKAVRTNLAMATGLDIEEWDWRVGEVFRNFGRYLLEFFNAHRWPVSQAVLDGSQESWALVRSGRGVILLTAHLGNWELGAVAMSRLGVRIGAVALPHGDARVNRFFDDQRRRCGVRVVPLGGQAMQRCLRLLREDWVLGIVGDRAFGSNGLEASLFGRRALMPRGPALLSLRAGVPVIPAFMMRESCGRFRFYLDAPMQPPTTPSGEGLREFTQQYAQVLERYIQRFPTQWLMFRTLAEGMG